MSDDDIVEQAVRYSQSLQPGGCCAGPEWCGHLCQYHQGFEDGFAFALQAIREKLEQT